MLTLQDTDREIVVNLIATNIVNSANPVPALQAIIGPKALDIPSQDSPRKWAEVAVRFCQDQDWDEQGKHPLLRLLAFGKALNERIPRIIQALESLPRPEDPFTARVLDNGMAFLGRQTLRQAVRELLRPDGPCVLRIRGPAKAGKSYSLKFLLFLRLQRKPLKPVLVENPGQATTASTIAQTLVRRMGADPSTVPNLGPETPLRSGQILADWVLNLAVRGSEPWWFVLDSFSDSNLPDDTKEFIRQLGLQIANGVGRDRLRVVLIDSEIDLPSDLRRLQKRDEVALDRAQWETNVRDYFAALALKLPPGRQPDLQAAIDDTIEQITAAKDAEFLSKLCEAVEVATDELSAA